MTILIRGTGQLAKAVSTCCARHFVLTQAISPDLDIFWVCHDTPVGPNGESNVDFVLSDITPTIGTLPTSCLILISSQLPVGTTAKLEHQFPNHRFACSPENIRVARGMSDFEHQARIVVGQRDGQLDYRLITLFEPFTHNIMLMNTETAECAKHFLNAYLALMIVFANEMKRICAVVGADPEKVSQAILSEPRVSPKAPLKPGGPYGGGNLERDLWTLRLIAEQHGIAVPVISHIKASNDLTPA